jgi:hypothetical protein
LLDSLVGGLDKIISFLVDTENIKLESGAAHCIYWQHFICMLLLFNMKLQIRMSGVH